MILQWRAQDQKLTFENSRKDYFKLFLIENLVQGFVNERNRYANSSIVSKQPSLHSVWSAWKDVSYRILVLFSDIYKNGHNWALKYEN
jgi:hypothetical protein